MSEPQTMLEKVARAIATGLGYEWDTLYASKGEWTADRGSRHDINVPYKPDFLEAARAALEAMREPTEGMAKAPYAMGMSYMSQWDAYTSFLYMINAALEGK